MITTILVLIIGLHLFNCFYDRNDAKLKAEGDKRRRDMGYKS